MDSLETRLLSKIDEEIKLKYDKLANYIDSYKRKLYLSDDIRSHQENIRIKGAKSK